MDILNRVIMPILFTIFSIIAIKWGTEWLRRGVYILRNLRMSPDMEDWQGVEEEKRALIGRVNIYAGTIWLGAGIFALLGGIAGLLQLIELLSTTRDLNVIIPDNINLGW